MERIVHAPPIAAIETDGHKLLSSAGSCLTGGKLLRAAAYLRWPRKTREFLASAAHISVRAAGYFLAGGESEKAARAIIREELD